VLPKSEKKMKRDIAKHYLITTLTLFFIGFFTSLVSAEEEQNKKVVDSSIDEVIVFGIRESLESALAAKRARANLTEIINADDIGKLPDENIAEVLENIPGVQIDRSAGIGSQVSVRGSSQNRVEINGRSTTPAKDERGGINFSDLPSTLVRSLNVVKVPTADMVEGSLGGTVNVKTYRGLKLKKPLKVVRAVSEYAENADKWNEKYSATFGEKFTTSRGDVGAIVNLSFMDKFVREDQLRVTPGVRKTPQTVMDFNDDGVYDPYYKPGFSDVQFGLQNIINSAFSGSLEWQAKDDLKFYVEGSYTDLEKQGLNQVASLATAASDMELDDPNKTFRYVNVAGYQVPMVTSSIIGGGIRNGRADLPVDTSDPNDGVQIRAKNLADNRDTQSYVAAIGGEWDTDNLNVVAEISAAGSDTVETAFVSIFQFNDPSAANFHNINARIRVPFYYSLQGDVLEYGPMPGAVSEEQLLDPNYWSMYLTKDQDTFFNNKEVAQKIDATWFFDNDIWTSVKAGVRFTQRSSGRSRQSQQTDQWPGFSAKDFEDYLLATPGDFFSFNPSADYLDTVLTLDPIKVAAHREELRQMLSLDTAGVIDPLQGFSVDENTSAIYVRGDFDTTLFGIPARGNIGVRGINTDQVSSGSEVLGDGTLRDVYHEQNYNNWLPSASLVLAPTEKLQLRLGYADIMRRPNFRDLSPTLQYPLNLGQAVNVGDPTLKPTTAKQLDAAVEYYFRKGSVASVGFYRKELESVISKQTRWNAICNPRVEDPYADNPDLARTTCTVDGLDGVLVNRISPVNLPGGAIEGVELSFLHYFRNLPKPFRGLGMIANYAIQKGSRDQTFSTPQFLRSSGEVQEFPLNFVRLSENSYNLTVFYERYRFNARIRYTYRDNFLVSESIDIANGAPLYTDDRGQLNASFSYKLNKTFTATFNGVNLLKSRKTNPGVFPDGPIARMSDSDRRISLGIRAKF
jgi:TonB-dependent receptor